VPRAPLGDAEPMAAVQLGHEEAAEAMGGDMRQPDAVGVVTDEAPGRTAMERAARGAVALARKAGEDIWTL
jgi:hypothetical protein